MAGVRPLPRFPPPSPWEVQPLGRLLESGALAWEPGVWPPEGDSLLVLWRPGQRPQFEAARGRVHRDGRAWRFSSGDAAAGWVVLVVPAATPSGRREGAEEA